MPYAPKGSNRPSQHSRSARSHASASQPAGTRFRAQGSASAGGVRSAAPAHRPTQRRTPSRKKSPLPVIAALIAAVAVVALVVVFVIPAVSGLFAHSSEPQVEAGQQVQVNIPEGASGDTIATVLSDAGVIPDRKTYFATVRALQADSQLKPGDYIFTTKQDPEEVVRQLVEGPNVEGVSLTVPEGQTVTQVADRVASVYGIPADTFLDAAKASAFVDDYPFLQEAADDSLEGFLFPKTYTFTYDPTAEDVIRAMLDQYEIEVASLDFDAARSLISSRYGVEMSDYDLLTLASIIEREARTDDQRANVASTFYNRLEIGMALQSDATMMYVTGGAVTAADLETESPYNTYLNRGLTPTPICNPSLASIEAALNPAETDYLYFLILPDEAYFSVTYDEHLAAIEATR